MQGDARALELLHEAINDAAVALERSLQHAAALPTRGARIFIEGAIGSLRHAGEEAAWSGCPRLIKLDRNEVIRIDGYSVGLRRGVNGMLTRCRAGEADSWHDEADADDEPGACMRSLVVDVAADQELCRLAQAPIFAGLLANALACHSWLHGSSGTVWTGTPGVAQTVAEIASGGRHFPSLGVADLGGLLDRRLIEEFRRLGWVELRSPLPPGMAIKRAA